MLNWDPGNAAERDEKLIGWIQLLQRIALATAIARCGKEADGKSMNGGDGPRHH